MNFSHKIKEEILSKPIKDDHCKLAFIAGLIRGSGVLYERDGELGLEFKASDEQTAMMLTLNFKSLFNYDIREISVSADRLNNKDKYYLSISGPRAIEILRKLEVFANTKDDLVINLKFFGKLTKKECCLKAFIRGLFVATGSCTLPSKNEKSSTSYHLEINFSHYAPAHETSEKLAQYGIFTKVVNRRDGYILYIKSAEEIKDFLAFLPAPVSVLKITDLMVNREFANNINRQKNCDLGNVNKQVEASAKQISAIDRIDKIVGLDTLKVDLRQVAFARKEFPEDTLNELAERLNLSKSCLNHRLRKLVCIADEL